MMRVFTLCALALATVAGFLHLQSHPDWASFAAPEEVIAALPADADSKKSGDK